MGLNRHRRGYASKEADSGVHSQDVESYWARPVSIFKLPSYHYHCHHHSFHHIISIINFFNPITRECQKHSTSTGTIALSRAVVPIHTSSFGISRNLDKTIPTHATRYQATPINLMHK